MDEAGDARDDPFAGLRVERVVRDDGRYVIYFSWPAEGPPAGEVAGREPSPAAASQPWNVSSGPPDDGPDEDSQRAPDEREPRV